MRRVHTIQDNGTRHRKSPEDDELTEDSTPRNALVFLSPSIIFSLSFTIKLTACPSKKKNPPPPIIILNSRLNDFFQMHVSWGVRVASNPGQESYMIC